MHRVPQDYEKALTWYTKAGDQGFVDAQYKLGYIYLSGKGVPHNYKFAYIWWSLAAENGHGISENKRDIIIKLLTSKELLEAQDIIAEKKGGVGYKKIIQAKME